MTSNNYVVISVNSLFERDKLIQQIYNNLTNNPDDREFIVVKDQENRIRVSRRMSNGILPVLVKTYLVIVIPMNIDLSVLKGLHGAIDFVLDETIDKLLSIVKELQTLNGHTVRKGLNNDAEIGTTTRQLAGILSAPNGEHRAGSNI